MNNLSRFETIDSDLPAWSNAELLSLALDKTDTINTIIRDTHLRKNYKLSVKLPFCFLVTEEGEAALEFSSFPLHSSILARDINGTTKNMFARMSPSPEQVLASKTYVLWIERTIVVFVGGNPPEIEETLTL